MEKASRQSIKQASLWMARMLSEEVTEEDKRAFELWRSREPSNDYAWRQLESLQKKLTSLPDPKVGKVILSQYRKGLSRRQILVWSGVSIAAMSLVLSSDAAISKRNNEYASETGEIKPITLSDGTLVVLNTSSRIRVDFAKDQRLIHLIEGEIMVTTSHHLTPFYVSTPQGLVTPLGTVFSVRLKQDTTQVSVFEGQVMNRATKASNNQYLETGQKSTFSSMNYYIKKPLLANEVLWTQGKIEVLDMPLNEFLDEVSRYRKGVVNIEPNLSDLRISGIYSMRDTDTTLQNLSKILPIQVRFRTRFWVTISRELSE
ncbi:FecR domain-containing protein [Vibrio sp.]|uniref:FecR domain-containing protein n=1 Tax=Vibrio sp. TaxID=678 RepID=UPI00311E7289